MIYIEDFLKSLTKIEPLDTGMVPKYSKDKNIKAVIFDIYGTLLVSSSGDVDQAEMSESNLKRALSESNIDVHNNGVNSLEHILHDFLYTIEICHQEAKKNKVPYPEVDILSVWEIVLLHAKRKNLISFNGEADIMRMTCVFEFLSNKVYPMPGMKETITSLAQKKLPLGIVSNAQFYTPVLMNYFLDGSAGFKEQITFFDQELTVFSYKLGRGKPDISLFEDLVPVLLRNYGLLPKDVLFVGNDMLKDIYTSSQVGFKTALFAGDRRSLRMRSDDERVKGLKPDYIITKLSQISDILDL